jgi:substrate import-associated zinc metallohydrolase lipoprotein
MKNILKYSLLIAIASNVVFTSCSSKKEDVSPKVEGLGGVIFTKKPLDTWINDNFTKPFNIEVKYRWDGSEVPLNKNLVPPLVAIVQPTMEAVKQIWIDPYISVAGADFIKTFCPKQYVLIGSANWNTDGTIVLGTAEGGRKVVLYQINEFNKKNIDGVKQMLHTIHHEFGHILHQNILYPLAFKQITPGSYTSNWYNNTEAEALELGYITSYSMSGPDEDFVEMIAYLLVEGQEAFNTRVATASPAAQASLIKKQQIVFDYFTKAYNINFKTLQKTTQTAIATFTK